MPGLQWQNVNIPLAVGADTSYDDRAATVGNLQYAENCEFDKLGALKKRHGFTAMAHAPVTPIRAIFSSGRELCIAEDRWLRVWDPLNDTWISRGKIGPCVGKTRQLMRDMYDHHHVDMDCDDAQEYVLCASTKRETWEDSVGVDRCSLGVWMLPDWQCKQDPYTPATTLLKPKVGHCSDGILAIGATAGATNVLGLYDYATATPLTPPAYFGALSNALYYDPNRRTYDIVRYSDTATRAYAVAFVRGPGANPTIIDIQARSDAHAVISANTLTAAANYVMITCSIDYDATNDCLWVLWVEMNNAGGVLQGQQRIWLTRFTEPLAPVWSRLLWTGLPPAGGEGPTENIHTLGSVYNETAGNPRIACAWSASFVSGGTLEQHERTYVCGVHVNNTNMSQVQVMHNENMLTKPWVQDERCYVTTVSDFERVATGLIYGYPWSANTTYELTHLGNNEGGGRGDGFEPAGVHDVGTASCSSVADPQSLASGYGEGAANNVFIPAAGKRAYANHSRSTTAYMGAAVWSGEGRPSGFTMRAFDAVELDYTHQPQAAKLQEGQVFVSGAYSAWYEGIECLESHIPTPPVFTGNQSQDVVASGLDAGTYFYIPVWIARDESGSLHRSIPGPWVDVVVDFDNTKVTCLVRSVGWTYRYYGSDNDSTVALALYRADASNGTFTRCNPISVTRNAGVGVDPAGTNSDDYITVVDDGQELGEPLYTNAGVYENVCPEGFEWCVTHNERVWTGGHFRRARVQYSKRYTPGTATELNFPPEFHEAMGFVLPSGEDCTGLAKLDDKMIIFSDRAIYAVAGVGPADDGSNSDFSQLTLVTDLIGCDDGRSVVSVPGVGVMFLGHGIIQMLTRSLQIEPVGQAVRDLLGTYSTIVSADALPERYQVLFLANTVGGLSIVLCWDTRQNAWTHWKPLVSGVQMSLVDACVHQGVYYVASSAEVYYYNTSTYRDAAGLYIPRDVRTGWIQVGGQNGWQRVRDVMLQAEYRDPHTATLTVYSDFNKAASSQTYTWDDAALVAFYENADASREQLKLRVIRQKCQAIQLRYQDADDTSTTGEASILFGLGLRVGVRPADQTKTAEDQMQ